MKSTKCWWKFTLYLKRIFWSYIEYLEAMFGNSKNMLNDIMKFGMA